MSHETARLLMAAAELLDVISAAMLLFTAAREGRLRRVLYELREPSEADSYPAYKRLLANVTGKLRDSLTTFSRLDFVLIVIGLALVGIASFIKLCVTLGETPL